MTGRCPYCGDTRTIHLHLSEWECQDCYRTFYLRIRDCPPEGGEGELDAQEEQDKSH